MDQRQPIRPVSAHPTITGSRRESGSAPAAICAFASSEAGDVRVSPLPEQVGVGHGERLAAGGARDEKSRCARRSGTTPSLPRDGERAVRRVKSYELAARDPAGQEYPVHVTCTVRARS